MSWLAPPPLPRTWEASVRDLEARKLETRVSSILDLTRHALRDDDARAKAVPLLERALSDDAPQVRAIAAVSLGDVGAHEALPRLLMTIDDPHAHVRQMAINALGEIGDCRAAQRLSRATTDERPEVRYQAIIAFSRVCTDCPDIDDALVRATSDEDGAVRYIALRLAEERAGHAPAPDAMIKAANEHLSDTNESVALAAAILLSNAGPKDETPSNAVKSRLLALVAGTTKSPEPEDEAEAIEIVGRLGLKEALPYLERRAFGLARFVRNTSVFAAKVALARMGQARAKEEILRDLASANGEKRRAAIVASGRARLVEAKPLLESRLPHAEADGSGDATFLSEALAALAV